MISTVLLFHFVLQFGLNSCYETPEIRIFPKSNKGITKNDLITKKSTIDFDVTELSFCTRFAFTVLNDTQVFLGSTNKVLWVDFESHQDISKSAGFATLDYKPYMYAYQGPLIQPLQWHHLCFSRAKNNLRFVMDGKYLDTDMENLEDFFISKEKMAAATFLLGFDAWDGNNGAIAQRFYGHLTELFAWTKSMSVDQMIGVTGSDCKLATTLMEQEPDIFDSRNLTPTRNSYYRVSMKPRSRFCPQENSTKNSSRYMLRSYQVGFPTASKLCKSFGGHLAVPRSEAEYKEMQRFVHEKYSYMMNNDCGHTFWLGIVKDTDGGWIGVDGTKDLFLDWGLNQPNGGDIQNCIDVDPVLSKGEFKISDDSCSAKKCLLCETKQSWMFTLRGPIPPELDIDTYYSLYINSTTGYIAFVGYHNTFISWNWDLNRLEMEDLFEETLLGYAYISDGVGTKQWIVDNVTMRLLFHQCEKDEFACLDNAECIPMDLRCDGKVDCPSPDESDEEDCKVAFIPTSYKKGVPPKRPKEGQKTPVSLDIQVDKVISMKELGMEFRVKIVLKMRWRDPRILFRNLKENTMRNVVKDSVDDLWLPELLFENTDTREQTGTDQGTQFFVEKEGEGFPNSKQYLLENLLYQGSENTMIMVRGYAITFNCMFQLRMFPFDHQTCPMILAVPSHLNNSVQMIIENIATGNSMQLVRYRFLNISTDIGKPLDRAVIELSFRRIFNFHLANTFFPTLCLLAITELTLFIDKSHFEATIMVALTSMLCMYTLYQSVATTLPQTAYLKMIDVWLLGCLTIPCFVFCILIVIDVEVSQGRVNNRVVSIGTEMKTLMIPKQEESVLQKLGHRAKIFLPIVTVFFVALYWVFALAHYFISG